MNEETIFDIIDTIAVQAKAIIGAHLQKQELVDALKQSAKDWDEVGKKMMKVFRDLEDDVRAYLGNGCVNIATGVDYAKNMESEYCVGDEVYFIGDGCAVKDRIVSVMVETENGYCVDIDDIFGNMDELVERLKEEVHG